MNIVDSSCWLEYLMDTEIGASIAPVVENVAELTVPTITLYEVYKKLLAEKNEEYALDVASYMQTGTVIWLDAALSLQAAHLSRTYKLPMADSIRALRITSIYYVQAGEGLPIQAMGWSFGCFLLCKAAHAQ